jgi:hypothetical protein
MKRLNSPKAFEVAKILSNSLSIGGWSGRLGYVEDSR